MTLAQHPATKVLSAILPSDLCRIICEFAAPHAVPTITTVYQLTRTEQKEELDIFAARWAEGGYGVQYIVEFSPNGRGGLVCRQIRVSSNWTRERERYGLGRKNFCLCREAFRCNGLVRDEESEYFRCPMPLYVRRASPTAPPITTAASLSPPTLLRTEWRSNSS